jgi:glutamyl-tRNA synthetase
MLPPAIVRFAPSPTGHFHIGGARTALYNFLLARQTGGKVILRSEDTDRKRSSPENLEELMSALRWLGIAWDEGPDVGGPHGPYKQSERKEIYLEYGRRLLDSGSAYRCFCTPERLEEVRRQAMAAKQPPRYDGRCRGLSTAEAEARVAAGERFVVRFKTPRDGTTVLHDRLRGEITVENRNIDDYIIIKSDGFALYHLAAIVDDHLMGITHVFRGAEWLGTFPLHAMIIRALGWEEPVWCHLSIFLKPSGKGKMSKRDVTSEQSIFVLGLRDLGYVPEAVLNWIALMGASFASEEEVLSMEEMCARFSLDHLNAAPARVSFDKLDHFNGLYLRKLAPEALAARIQPFFERAGIEADRALLRRIAPIIQERIVTLDDAVAMAGFFFRPEVNPAAEDLVARGLTPAQSLDALQRARDLLQAAPSFEPEAIEPGLRTLAEEMGLKPGQLFGILRSAVTGQTVSPPLFESMAIVGKETCLARLDQAAGILGALATAPES